MSKVWLTLQSLIDKGIDKRGYLNIGIVIIFVKNLLLHLKIFPLLLLFSKLVLKSLNHFSVLQIIMNILPLVRQKTPSQITEIKPRPTLNSTGLPRHSSTVELISGSLLQKDLKTSKIYETKDSNHPYWQTLMAPIKVWPFKILWHFTHNIWNYGYFELHLLWKSKEVITKIMYVTYACMGERQMLWEAENPLIGGI